MSLFFTAALAADPAPRIPEGATTAPTDPRAQTNAEAAAAAERDATPARRRRRRFGVRLDVGFPHWMSDRYRTPAQARSASFGLGFTPGLKFVEIQGRWEWIRLRVEPGDPDFGLLDGRWIDITTLGVGLTQEFFLRRQSLRLGIHAAVVLPRIGGAPVSVGWAAGYRMAYLFQVRNELRVGPFLDLRENTVRLRKPDGSRTSTQVDACYAAGVTILY